MPGVMTRKASAKRASCGLSSLLRVCQAMSMPITTVLPLPVAILNAIRGSPPFAVSFSSRSQLAIHASPYRWATSVR